MDKQNATKVVTGQVRLSYANVWEPQSINGSEPKYSVSIIIPKSDKATIAKIQAAIDAAIQSGIGKFGGKMPNKSSLKLPLRDGDAERTDEAYQNAFFVNANSKAAPQIVDSDLNRIIDKAEADIRLSRLALSDLTARVLAHGLGLLGITAPERM